MAQTTPRHIHTEESINFWSNKIHIDWKKFFSAKELSFGREIFSNSEIRELELTDSGAIINAKFDQEDCYALIEWEGSTANIRVASQDQLLGRALAVAGFHEIDKLIAEEKPNNTHTFQSDFTTPSPDQSHSYRSEPKIRPLVLKFELKAESIFFRPYWQFPDGSLGLAIKQGKQEAVSANAAEREKLIRLASRARRANFKFQPKKGAYTIDNLEQVRYFWDKEVHAWQSHFKLELPTSIQRLSKGIQSVELTVCLEGKEQGTLDFAWDFRIEKNILQPEDSASLIRSRQRPLLLDNLGLVSLSKQKIDMLASWKRWMDLHPQGDIPRYFMFSLLKNDPVNLEITPDLKKWRDGLSKMPEKIDVLPTFLRSYQNQGVTWLWHLCDNNCHGLLADEMGLGKTLQILTLLAKRDLYKNPNIIVCPASVVPVWEKEVRRFFPHIKTEVLKAGYDFISCDKKVLWLASYTQLRRHKFLLDRTHFGYVVLDEAQHIKNPDSKVSQACMKIQAKHRIVLTGTPLENRYLDIWTLFRFLMPGLMGNRKQFEERFLEEGAHQNIRKQIAPFVLRRTKEDVLKELPGKTEIDCICPLTDIQSQEYERLTQQGIDQLGNDIPTAVKERSLSFLTLLTRLRQTCCDPTLLPWIKAPISASSKINTLVDKLGEILASQYKAVIFSQFTSLIGRVSEAIDKHFPHVNKFTLTGQTKDRAEPVNEFQNSHGASVILVSLRAGGFGITLHSADYVFLMDPWWNPAVEDQAIDRVHRIGQDKPVFVYRMVTPGTIEARIQALKNEKKGMFSNLVGAMSDISDIKNYYQSLSDLIDLSLDGQ